MSKAQKKTTEPKPKKGTPENPHRLDDPYDYVIYLKEGVHEFWDIEQQSRKNGKWRSTDWTDEIYSSYKDAQRGIKEIQESIVDRLEYDWKRKQAQKDRVRTDFLFRFNETTSPENIQEAINELNEIKEKIEKKADKKQPKEPEFKIPEYPKFRVIRKTITVKTEVND